MEFIKSFVASRGGFLFGPGSVPKGINLFHDIKRYNWLHCANLIVDVGANTGQFASSALASLSSCSVISFEPVSQSFNELMVNSHLDPRWSVYHTAVGANNGTTMVTCDGTSQMNHIKRTIEGVNPTNSINEYEKVSIVSLDNFFMHANICSIGMLKTDTEGFDAQVLIGAKTLIDNNQISSVLVEVTFDAEDVGHSQFSVISNILGPKFQLAGLYEQGSDGPNCVIDRLDAFFLNRETFPFHSKTL